MNYDLITDEDFDALPDDPEQKFLALEAACRRNLNKFITRETPDHFDSFIRLQYMQTVATAASELGVQGISFPANTYSLAEFESFMLEITGAATRLRLRGIAPKAYSVRLSNRSKGKIELQIARLRALVEDSEELSDEKRTALLKKLTELSEELMQTRLNFAKVMAIVSFVSFTAATVTSFLADLPDAINTITVLIGQDKEAEDAEAKRIGAPPAQKALPAPAIFATAASLDDEIPF